MGHHPDAHAHPDGRGQLSGRRHHPPGGCVHLCERRRQDAEIRRGESGGVRRILWQLHGGLRRGHPHLGQQQAFVLLPERKAGRRGLCKRLCGGQPEHLHRAGLSCAEGGQVGSRRPAAPQHRHAAAEPGQAGGAELCAGPAGLHGQKRPLLRCAGLRGQPAGHQTGAGSH